MPPPPLPIRYLDPKIDLAFKRVFGEHANLLKSFLNALLPLPAGGEIDSLEYLTPEQAPEIPGLQKYSIVDVKCTDQQGRIFIVEMQMLWTASFEQRMVFGASQAYVKQLRAGQTWRELRPVYALAIMNSKFPPASGIAADNYYHHYRIVNVEHPKQMLAGLEFVFIELPKFKPESRGEKRLQTLWLRFLREVGAAPSQVIDAELLQDLDIAQALKLVEQAAYTEAELAGYHTSLDQTTNYISMLADADAKGREEGKAEGVAEGKAEGKAEGIAEGIAEGQAKGERAKALAIASALLADGLSIERDAAVTGLSIEELRAP